MGQTLIVTANLQPSGAARQLCLLASSLPRERLRVLALGRSSPWCEQLRQQGVHLDTLDWHRPFDPGALWRLHRLLREERPETLHVWGREALGPVLLAGQGLRRRLLVSAGLPRGRQPSLLDRCLLRFCPRLLALDSPEAAAYRRLGHPQSRLSVLPCGVPLPSADVQPATLPNLPEKACVLVVLGPVERHKGQFEAVWAFDILSFIYPHLYLVIVGTGSGIDRPRAFVRCSQRQSRVYFPGVVDDVQPWLARADIVWVPCLRDGGRLAVLEGMAAGKPVVASRLPGLAESIVEGETGYLVRPGDKAELCRQTRLLIESPDARRRMGESGRQRVAAYHPLSRMVEDYSRMLNHPGDTP